MRGVIILIFFFLGCGTRNFRTLAVIPIPQREFIKPYPVEIYIDEIKMDGQIESKIVIFNVEGEFEEWSPVPQEELLRSALISGFLLSRFCGIAPDSSAPYRLLGRINKWKFDFKCRKITWEEKGYDYWITYSFDTDITIKLEDKDSVIWRGNFTNSRSGEWNVFFLREIKESFEEVVSYMLRGTVEAVIDSLDSLIARGRR